MRPVVALALVGISLGGCAQILDVGGLTYAGPDVSLADATDAPFEAEAAAAPDVLDAQPSCDGPCAPTEVVVASGLEPTIATDGAFVYLRVGAEVESCSVAGCATPAHVFTTSGASPRLVAASADHVYWTDGTAVFGCASGVPCGTPTTLMDLQPLALEGLAASRASSWVLASGSNATTLRVLRATLDGSSQDQVVSQSNGGGSAGPVTTVPKSPRVYWAVEGTPAVFDCVAPPCATADHNTAGLPFSPIGLVATGAAVFFGTSAGLYTAAADLTNARPLAGSGAVVAVALRTSSVSAVYFVEHVGASWNIQSCPTSGSCAPALLHTTTTSVTALAGDDASIVWIEGDTVMRMVLP